MENIENWDVILMANNPIKETWVNRLLYKIIQLGLRFKGETTKYHHAQLVININGTLFIAEATASGFHITKTLLTWRIEQQSKQRIYEVVKSNNIIKPHLKRYRFELLLGSKYDAKYWEYLFDNQNKDWTSVNCFQAVGFVIGMDNWNKATPSRIKKFLLDK